MLAIEILGTRILGPFYGVSLFLWSALITVTLVALSAGYVIGGRLADRKPRESRIYLLLAGAGLWTVLIPWITHPVLALAEPLGLRVAVLVAAFLLFAPPLTLLGMVSPYAIRVRASSMEIVGRTAGDLYAISTLGSVAAALLTGFILIPNVGVQRLTLMTGGLLLGTAALGWALNLKSGKARAAAVSALLIGAAGIGQIPSEQPRPASGLIAIEQSPYAEIRVLDTPDRRLRLLVIDGGTHTIARTGTWESAYPYVALLGVTRCLVPKPGRVLVVGVGGGSVLKDYASRGWSVDAVEIDPVVVKVAREHFGLSPEDGQVFTMDGRRFIGGNRGPYDIVVLDAFGSSSIPFHLVTREAFGLIASRLDARRRARDQRRVRRLARRRGACDRRDAAHAASRTSSRCPASLRQGISATLSCWLRHTSLDVGSGCDAFERGFAQRGWTNRFVPDIEGAPVLTDDLNPVDLWSSGSTSSPARTSTAISARSG